MKIPAQSTRIETRAPLNRLTHPWFLALAMSALLAAQVTVLANEVNTIKPSAEVSK